MGEIDTKPIESVQASLSLFGEKNDQRKHRHTSSINRELEKELDGLHKDLANYKVQVEIKDSEYMQVLVKLEYYQKMSDELSTALKNCELERDSYLDECREARDQIYEFELKMTEMANQLSETMEISDQLLHSQGQLEDMGKQIEAMHDLENQLLAKSIFIDSLQSELKQAHELSSSSVEDASNVLTELDRLEADLEVKERKNQDQAAYIVSLEMELDQIRRELNNANEEVGRLSCNIESLSDQLEEVKVEMNELEKRENEAQVEIATLKAEIHRGRSKIAAAEAAELRANSVKSGLYLAVQELAIEAEEAKKETKVDAGNVTDEADSSVLVCSLFENPTQDDNLSETNESIIDNGDSNITISLAEYESLLEKAEKVDQSPVPRDENSIPKTSENTNELGILKKDLEAAMVKINEFRTRAEQAVTRAESAEKAKLALEDQLRKWREQKQRRKAALAALKEETAPKVSYPHRYDQTPATYQPLGKVLNMKF